MDMHIPAVFKQPEVTALLAPTDWHHGILDHLGSDQGGGSGENSSVPSWHWEKKHPIEMENHRKTIGKWWFNGIEWDLMGFNGVYPLVNIQKAIENGHLIRGFSH